MLVTNNDDAYLTALKLHESGVGVARIIDVRAGASSELAEAARKAGLQVQTGAAIAGVETSGGGKEIGAVKVAPYSKGRGRVVNEEKVACDFVAVSGGYNPVVHLWCHNAGKLKFDETIQSFRPDRHGDPIMIVGSANGTFDLSGCLEEGYAAGEAAANATGGKTGKVSKARTSGGAAGSVEAIWFAPATGKYNEGNKHFIDFKNDVTAADLELAQREGYESVEHTKRYTTLGMATDQGKTSNVTSKATEDARKYSEGVVNHYGREVPVDQQTAASMQGTASQAQVNAASVAAANAITAAANAATNLMNNAAVQAQMARSKLSMTGSRSVTSSALANCSASSRSRPASRCGSTSRRRPRTMRARRWSWRS